MYVALGVCEVVENNLLVQDRAVCAAGGFVVGAFPCSRCVCCLLLFVNFFNAAHQKEKWADWALATLPWICKAIVSSSASHGSDLVCDDFFAPTHHPPGAGLGRPTQFRSWAWPALAGPA